MRSRRMKIIVGAVVAGIALLALTPVVAAAAGAFGARDGSGPIGGGSFGPVGAANRAGQTATASDTISVMGGNQYSLVAVAASELNMERTALVAELRAGKTIAQVAAEHNVASSTIVDAFVAARADLLKAMVADGRITQAEADALLAQAREHATEQISEPWTQWAGSAEDGMQLRDGSCGGLGPRSTR